MIAQASGSGANPAPFRATVAPTDVEKAYADYNNAMMQAYAAKVGQQNAMWGGLAGLGSAGITTLPKLLSGGGASGLGSAASDAIPGFSDALASAGGDVSAGDLLASLAMVA
jgi:hypothetical protein